MERRPCSHRGGSDGWRWKLSQLFYWENTHCPQTDHPSSPMWTRSTTSRGLSPAASRDQHLITCFNWLPDSGSKRMHSLFMCFTSAANMKTLLPVYVVMRRLQKDLNAALNLIETIMKSEGVRWHKSLVIYSFDLPIHILLLKSIKRHELRNDHSFSITLQRSGDWFSGCLRHVRGYWSRYTRYWRERKIGWRWVCFLWDGKLENRRQHWLLVKHRPLLGGPLLLARDDASDETNEFTVFVIKLLI